MNPSYECMRVAREESRAELLEMRRWDVSRRLNALELGEGSHENLSAIANVIYEPKSGWTREACDYLRNQLMELIGGERDAQRGCAGGTGGCVRHDVQEEVDAGASVTSELRKFVETYLMNNTTIENEKWLAMTGGNLLAITDRIDEKFAEYQEAVEALALVITARSPRIRNSKEKSNE